MDQAPVIKKTRRVSPRPIRASVWDENARQLRQVERRMDTLLRRVLDGLDSQQMLNAADRLDLLVRSHSELRLATVAAYPDQMQQVLACIDLELGPLPGFRDALERLCDLCITSYAVRTLRAKLYSVSAHAAESCPELLPTVALAVLSLEAAHPLPNPFLEMVVCASVLEWAVDPDGDGTCAVSLDVSSWLAAEPSDTLRAAVGERRAHYYAAIPGIFSFLDPLTVLFDAQALCALGPALTQAEGAGDGSALRLLADGSYVSRLRQEIRRVRHTLGEQYPASCIADVEMLASRALEALEDLPPQVNPLLQAIFVQSWVHYLDTC